MDDSDPWANAWGDSTTSVNTFKSEWKPSLTIPTDDEHDISIPSWTGSPPHSPQEEPSIWSQATTATLDASSAWAPSRFTNILNASKSSIDLAEEEVEIASDSSHDDASVPDERKVEVATPEPVSPQSSAASGSRSAPRVEISDYEQDGEALSSPRHTVEDCPPSPDGFGTFETAGIADGLSPELNGDPWARESLPLEKMDHWSDSPHTAESDVADTDRKVVQAEEEWESTRQSQYSHVVSTYWSTSSGRPLIAVSPSHAKQST